MIALPGTGRPETDVETELKAYPRASTIMM